MDLGPMVTTSEDEAMYSNYDNRPIRPMDQDALNEALARLPIVVDEDDSMGISDPSSIKTRRQPILAYSTRRKNLPGVNTSQSLLDETPTSNKRKLGGCITAITPSANKLIKQLDSRQELIQLKEENKTLEEAKINLQLECVLINKAHETELETLKQEHQQAIDTLVEEHRLQREQFHISLADKEQLLAQANLELENLRNDHTLLLLEKDTLDKIVAEYQLIKEEMNNKLAENESITKNLREEIENLTKTQQQKQSTSRSALANGRMPLKTSATDRSQTTTNTKNEPVRSKTNAKASITREPKKDEANKTPALSVNTSMNKSTDKPPLPKSKPKVIIGDKKKCLSSDKHSNLTSTRTKSKAVTTI